MLIYHKRLSGLIGGNNVAKLILQNITWDEYKALQIKDQNTMQFISDLHCIYIRNTLYSGRHEIVSADPTSPEMGVVYINSSTLEAKVYTGSGQNVISKGFTTKISDNIDHSVMPTAKAVADFVSDRIASVAGGSGVFVSSISVNENGTMTVNKGTESSTVTMTNMVYNPSYNASTKQLKLPVAGGSTLTIDLSKDLVVTAGKYNDATSEIWLTLSEDKTYTDTTKLIKIPVSNLIDVYTGVTTTTTKTTVGADNKISVDVKISSQAGNSLTTKTDGLYVTVPDDTTKATKLGTGHTNNILVAASDGDIADSDVQIGTNILSGTPNDKTVATEVAVKTYVDTVANNVVSTASSDATQKANTAESNAKTYADGLIVWHNW